ncbi:hypothetical protein ACJZ2D_015936 [Fusarium nematophilum]
MSPEQLASGLPDKDQEAPKSDTGGTVPFAAKRPRAKQACRECNARRVRSNAMESNPCSNCRIAGCKCELVPSLRGRYPRRRSHKRATNRTGVGSTAKRPTSTAQVTESGPREGLKSPNSELQTRIATPSIEATDASGVLFFGESHFLTLVPEKDESKGNSNSCDDDSDTAMPKSRMLFCVPNTPDSFSECISPVWIATSRYLHCEGALIIPNLTDCIPALQSYFTWFHPCFPVVDRADFSKKLINSNVSYLLLQSMLFIAMTYCDDDVVASMGFSNRTEAKTLLYTRARLLFRADWEKECSATGNCICLFSALCIHTISIKKGNGVLRPIAENRAQMCLLGLKEVQKYWGINNNILDLFLRYLDVSVAQRIGRREGDIRTQSTSGPDQSLLFPTPQSNAVLQSIEGTAEGDESMLNLGDHLGRFEEDESFNLVFGPWEAELPESLDLGLRLSDMAQIEGLDFLSRSL